MSNEVKRVGVKRKNGIEYPWFIDSNIAIKYLTSPEAYEFYEIMGKGDILNTPFCIGEMWFESLDELLGWIR